jgi:hypothetical protein
MSACGMEHLCISFSTPAKSGQAAAMISMRRIMQLFADELTTYNNREKKPGSRGIRPCGRISAWATDISRESSYLRTVTIFTMFSPQKAFFCWRGLESRPWLTFSTLRFLRGRRGFFYAASGFLRLPSIITPREKNKVVKAFRGYGYYGKCRPGGTPGRVSSEFMPGHW